MSALFLDSSALAKRYLQEVGSGWLTTVTRPSSANVLIIADLTIVEIFSLLARRGREGTLTQARRTRLGNAFLLHADTQYLRIALDDQVLAQARGLVGRYPLRALDAIQLGSALHAGAILAEPITFISSDRNLLAAAVGEGLLADDPLAHP